MLKKTLVALALSLPISLPAHAESYVVDTEGAHASINFATGHLGFSVLTGRFDTFTGEFEFDAEDPEGGSVSIEIDTGSINSNHAKRDDHLRGEDFFDVANHPKATFVSTSIQKTSDTTAIIFGDLTLRGVTKPVEIAATHVGGGDDPWGGYRQGFSGTTTIIPADFGMPHGIAGQTVDLAFEVEGIRK